MVQLAPPKQEVLPAVRARVIKEDPLVTARGSLKTVQFRSYETEDEFDGLYASMGKDLIIEPPYLPRHLESLVQCNNTLPVCIDAVVTNVHGSGFDIVPMDEKDHDTDAHKALIAFFDEVYPGVSFLNLRKELGYDQERTGLPYMEVIRDAAGAVICLRRLDPKLMRLVRLDEPITVPHKFMRDGREREVQLPRRYRRFVQQLTGQTVQWFKEYGCKRELDCVTGKWAAEGESIPLNRRASEVLYFPTVLDSLTPYGIPKWISELPSVLGSRKSEEANLEFFDAGGVPPLMIIVHGGALSGAAAEALRDHFQGGKKGRHHIPVIEALATGGDLNSPSNTKITVERFGSERVSDSMWEKYDAACEKRIRRAWRLPPMFVGGAEDHNFATAVASYRLTEAQVFGPARRAFDDLINRTLMKELDPKGLFYFRSKPITMRDIETQLKAMDVAISNKLLSRTQIADKLNEISDLDLNVDDDDLPGEDDDWFTDIEDRLNTMEAGGGASGQTDGLDDETGDANDGAVAKADTKLSPVGPEGLADQVFQYFEFGAPDGLALLRVLKQVNSLSGEELTTFKKQLTEVAMNQIWNPGLGIDFADRVVSTILGMLGDKPAQA